KNYTLSVSGGSEKTLVHVSGNFYDEEGTVHHSSNKVYNFRTNVSHSFNDKLKLTVRLNAAFRKLENEASGNYGAIYAATRNMPWDDPFTEDGSIKIGT